MTLELLHQTVEGLGEDLKKFQQMQTEKLQTLEQKFAKKLELSEARPQLSLKATLMGAPSNKAFESYLRLGDRGFETKALSTGEEPGSFIIPSVVQERIAKHMESFMSIRSLARIMTISSGSVEVIVDQKLPEVGWVTEMGERPELAPPTVARIPIVVHELYAKPRATQKLLDDAAINVEDWLVTKVAEKMSRSENLSFIQGDGEGKPRGFLTYDTASQDEWAWGTLEEIATGVNGNFAERAGCEALIDLVGTMKTEYLSGCVWIMSRSAQTVVRKLRDYTSGQYLWQPALGEKQPPTLLGFPVFVMDEMPPLVSGTPSKSIVFGNFKEAYQIVDRQHMNVLRDPYSAKPYVEFYITKRVGGAVINFEALKVLNFRAAEEEGE